jgi:protein ImuA
MGSALGLMRMEVNKTDIVSKLQSDIFRLQGFKQERSHAVLHKGLEPILSYFSHAILPTGCLHEFLSGSRECSTASQAFIASLVGTLLNSSGIALWISSSRLIFPPALLNFNIQPDRFIFIDLKKERDALWAMDEALKCGALSVVIGEINNLSFTESRRLQLAVEQSQVTGFIVRNNSSKIQPSAAVSRWRVTALPGEPIHDLPGIGFPKWRVELLRVRNGKPGVWDVCWINDKFLIKDRETAFDSSASSGLKLAMLTKAG